MKGVRGDVKRCVRVGYRVGHQDSSADIGLLPLGGVYEG